MSSGPRYLLTPRSQGTKKKAGAEQGSGPLTDVGETEFGVQITADRLGKVSGSPLKPREDRRRTTSGDGALHHGARVSGGAGTAGPQGKVRFGLSPHVLENQFQID